MCLYVLSSVFWRPLRFPHKNDVRFVFNPVVCRRSYLCFFLCRCVQWFSTLLVYMSFTVGVLLEAGTAYPLTAPGLNHIFVFLVGPRSFHLFSFLCCVDLFCCVFFVVCLLGAQCCHQCLWIVNSWLLFGFLCRVSFGCPMLPPVSLDCQFLIGLRFSLTFIEWSNS
jgi:hypothetical protein